MFFDYSISAMLTLLVNGIVRPTDEHNAEDLRRVDTWLRVTDILATESERPDLLEKKEFILHMRTWTLKVIEATQERREFDMANEYPFVPERDGRAVQEGELVVDDQWLPDLTDVHADIFPLPLVGREFWEPWTMNTQGGGFT